MMFGTRLQMSSPQNGLPRCRTILNNNNSILLWGGERERGPRRAYQTLARDFLDDL